MSYTKEQLISPNIVENVMSYEDYREMIDSLLSKDQTTGDDHSEEMLDYSRMNVQRMKRLDKQVELTDELKSALQDNEKEMVWLVLTEAWCGDAAQNIPVIAKMARESDQITLKLILRDKHLDIMDQYLTNGGRSIPKLVCLDAETLDELGSWGPRPGNFQPQVIAWMDNPDLSQEEWGQKLHKWYAKDKTQTLQSDFVKLIAEWSKK